MSLGSVVGFALVFVVVAWTLSATGGIALARSRAWLRDKGPLAERRAAGAVAAAPVALAAMAVTVLVLQSAFGVDHCPVHGHHAHLCITHGAQWLEKTWVVVALAMAAAAMLARCTLVIASVVRGARSIRELHALSRDAGEVRIVESDRAFCFVAGADQAAIYVSSTAWAALSDVERSALVAHESAHVGQGDLRARVRLELWLVLAAPLAGALMRDTWMQATERLCDARAAEATGEPASVASAMVSLCRLHAVRPVASFGFTPAADELEGRVRAVLVGGPLGERTAAHLSRCVLASSLVLVAAAAIAAEPLHHAFETLLG